MQTGLTLKGNVLVANKTPNPSFESHPPVAGTGRPRRPAPQLKRWRVATRRTIEGKFMKTTLVVTFAGALLLVGCANPLNRATSDDYAETCKASESNGRLQVAEEACYRALVNVDWGNLGTELKSERLYNLARIKRQLAKFAEAEQLLKESLAIQEKLPSPSEPKIGRRLIELSVNLAAQDKWTEGANILERALPIIPQFTGQERAYAIEVLTQHSKHLKTMNQVALAEQFEAKASALR